MSQLGAVYDRGYRPYDGVLGGRGASRWALWRLTVRRALGLRRSWRQKVLPWTLLGLATIPAAVDLGIRFATRNTPLNELDEFDFLSFRDYVGTGTLLLLFVAVAAPDVICPDRHDRVLPLIFARPLTGDDYVLAKVGGIASLVFGFMFVPALVLYVGQMLLDDDGALSYLGDHGGELWKVPLSIAALAIYFAAVSVALASLTDRRIVGGLAFLGFIFIPSIVSAILSESVPLGESTLAGAFNLLQLPLMVRDLIFEGRVDIDDDLNLAGASGAGVTVLIVYGLVVGGSLLFLHLRYREAKP